MNEKKTAIDVVMPTWENERMATVAKQTITQNTSLPIRFYKDEQKVTNKGWMWYCNEGLKESLDNYDSEYVLLTNDDIQVGPMTDWAIQMTMIMDKFKDIGAVGPLTNRACGWSVLNEQNCLKGNIDFFKVPYISFFFILLRKEAIKKVGYLDENLPGGDDLDLSFRLIDAGYSVAITPKVYVNHLYAQTGKRIYGSYWDSPVMSEKIHKALCDKHGFKRVICAFTGYEEKKDEKTDSGSMSVDSDRSMGEKQKV